MRRRPSIILSSVTITIVAVAACSSDIRNYPPIGAPAGGSGGAGSPATSTSNSSSGGAQVCTPGTTQACGCSNGVTGTQVCDASGAGWHSCDCAPIPCVVGTVVPCYEGLESTEGVGICHAGTKLCKPDGSSYTACALQVLPQTDVCTTSADDDCDGSSSPCVEVPAWVRTFGKPGAKTLPLGLGVDPLGKVTLALQGSGIDFGTGPIDGVAVVVYDPLGKQRKTIAIDGDPGWTSFGLTPDGGFVLASRGPTAFEIARYNADGDNTMADSYWLTEGAFPTAVAADAQGNMYVAGTFTGTISFAGEELTAPTSNSDTFLLKLGPVADLLWLKQLGSPGGTVVKSLSADADGNLIVVGTLDASADFGAGKVQSAGGDDVFVAKLDPAGSPIFVKLFGDAQDQPEARGALDANGNILLTGTSNGAIDFGGGPITTPGAFVAKLDPTGAHVYSRGLGGSGNQVVGGVAADVSSNVMVVGGFQGAADFGGGTLTSAGQEDLYVARYSPTGTFLTAHRFGDAGSQVGLFVAADPAGMPVIAGYFNGALDTAAGSVSAKGTFDTFLVRLASP